MAKRPSENQISSNNPEDESPEVSDPVRLADPETLSKRKNATKGSFPSPITGSQPASNPFASGGFKFTTVGATTTSSIGTSLFSTGSASSPTITSVESSNNSSATLFPTNTTISSNSIKDDNDDLKIKFRALNEKFEQKLSELVKTNLYGDYSAAVEKYLAFAKKIKAEGPSGSSTGSSKPAFSFKSTPTSSTPTPPAFQFSSTLPNKASLSSTTSTPETKSLFTFGTPKTADEQPKDTSSDQHKGEADETEDKSKDDKSADTGLKFVFTPSAKSEPSPFVFNKTNSETEKKQDDKPDLAFKFVPPATKTESAFKFSTPVTKTDSPFTLSASVTKDSGETKNEEPRSLFTSNVLLGADKEGTKKIGTEGNHTWGPEKGIKFGAKPSSDTEPQKPLFGNPVAPGTPGALKSEAPKPFSFSSSASNNSTESETKPSLFGMSSTTPTTGGLFGTTPVSFSNSDNKSDTKGGLFGTASAAAPVFQFGSSSAPKSGETKPLFGSTAGGSGSFTSSTTPLFSFSSTPSSASSSGATAVGNEGEVKEEGDGEGVSEAGGESTNFTAQGPGEENEDSLYEKKAKVYSNVDGKMQAEGIGLLRVLKHKETKKSRVVVRADGGGRVLLNVLLHKGFSYKANKAFVTIAELTGEGVKQHTVRVKTSEDAAELSKILEENK